LNLKIDNPYFVFTKPNQFYGLGDKAKYIELSKHDYFYFFLSMLKRKGKVLTCPNTKPKEAYMYGLQG